MPPTKKKGRIVIYVDSDVEEVMHRVKSRTRGVTYGEIVESAIRKALKKEFATAPAQ